MTDKTTRRAVLGGIAAGAFATSARSRARILGANDRINVGLMGLNGRGQAINSAFLGTPGAEITRLADVDSQVLAKRAGEFRALGMPIARTDADYRRLLSDPDLDAIAVATPDHWHAKAAADVMDAGKHVYVEKPLGMTAAEGEALIGVQRRTGRVLQMGNQQRSSVETRELVDRVRAGELGEIYEAHTWYANSRKSIGAGVEEAAPAHLDWDLWQGPRPRGPYRSNLVHYNWHWFWRYGTGEICNNALHEVDVARWLMDVSWPETVTARGARRFDLGDWEMYDSLELELNYTGGRVIRWDGQSCNGVLRYGRGRGVLAFGTKGSVLVDRNGFEIFGLNGETVLKREAPVAGATTNTIGFGPLDVLHAINFAETIRGTGTGQSSPVAVGHVSTALCHLGNIAWRADRELKIDPTTGRPEGDDAMAYWAQNYEPGWEIKV